MNKLTLPASDKIALLRCSFFGWGNVRSPRGQPSGGFMMSRSITSRRGGITLVEVLVIVGMVAILAGLLFPVVVRARRKAIDVKCVARLEAIYAALSAYMADYDRRFPITYYVYTERDDPEFLNEMREALRRLGLPVPPLVRFPYRPPWPPPPPPPSWYTPRVAMRDYVEDESIWFCPGRPKEYGYEGPPGVHSEMGYTYNTTLAGAPIDQLTWPLHEVPVLFDMPLHPNFKAPGHTGTGFNELRLDGTVVKVRVPRQGLNVRVPWKWVEAAVQRGAGALPLPWLW